MFQLINKITWYISLILGFILMFLIGVLFDGMDSHSLLDDDAFLIWLIIPPILSIAIKNIFFSDTFIQERLEFFASQLSQRNEKVSSPSKETEPEKLQHISLTHTEEKKEESVEPDYNTLKEEAETLQKQAELLDQNKIPEQTPEKEVNNDTHIQYDAVTPDEPSKLGLYIKKFFAENLLAKIGSILVFLGVVFLMSLVWNQIPSVGKLIIGFMIGFGTYFTGVFLEKKGLSGESRILLGTGILINFLVILAGKYIIGDNFTNTTLLTTGVTFFFLILNTIFGVVTSLVYKSRTLLLFSFIFAYINPFLTGGSSDNPYTLIGYGLIISLGALFIGKKLDDDILQYSAFIGGNLLFLFAPFQTEIGWISKLVASALLGVITILNISKDKNSHISSLFIGNYIFIILLLFAGGSESILGSTGGFISYMLSIVLFFGMGVWLFLKNIFTSLTTLLLFPILIVLGLIFFGSMAFIAPALGIIVLVYLVSFYFLENTFPPYLKYLFFGLLGGFIFTVNINLAITSFILPFSSFLTVVIITFIFLITAYYLSYRKDSGYLYSIGTLGAIFMLAPILVNKSMHSTIGEALHHLQAIEITLSIVALVIFTVLHWILPFINKELTKKGADIKNLLIGSIGGILFIGFQLFNYGQQYFPGVILGLSFGLLAIIYFALSYFMMEKIGISEVKSEVSAKNTVFSYLFISISLFSLAIALVFAKSPEIISTVWLFEATILFYFYTKTSEKKIYTLGIILFIIGILQLFDISAGEKEFLFLIPFSLIFGSFVFNLKYLNTTTGAAKVLHDLFHILGIGTLGYFLMEIIPSTGHGWSLLGISVFIALLGFIYAQVSSKILKIFFIFIYISSLILHVQGLEYMLDNIDRDLLGYLRVLQYVAFGIFIGASILWNKYNTLPGYNKVVNGAASVYILLIVSGFVLDIFDTTFAVTLFWALVSSILLFYGISTNKIKLRTIGLYLFSLVLGKIFLYDLWYALDDAITRVFALIIIGVLLIVISTKYTKKYGNNLKGEFDFGNINEAPEKKKE